MNKRYISFDEFTLMLQSLCKQIDDSGFKPDVIVPILRGGAFAGTMMSHYYKVPMVGVTWTTRSNYDLDLGNESNCWLPELALEGKKILIVDDILDTGKTIVEIIADWDRAVTAKLAWGSTIKVAALQERYTTVFNADFCVERINNDDWMMYPWETFNANIS